MTRCGARAVIAEKTKRHKVPHGIANKIRLWKIALPCRLVIVHGRAYASFAFRLLDGHLIPPATPATVQAGRR